jgi:hypothetical protein
MKWPRGVNKIVGVTTMARGLPINLAKELLAMNPSSSSLINTRTVVITTLLAIGATTSIAVKNAKADEWNKKTIVTIGEPVQVQKDLLQPGKYVFKLLDTVADRHVVQIFNADESHIIDTILAIPTYRMNPDGRQFTFYETPEGSAKAMKAWYYPGDNFGQEFRYPKHLVMLTTASEAMVTPQPALAPPTPEAAAVQPPEPAPAQSTDESTQVAQNAPPPEPTPAPEPAPAVLPKTGSLFPVIGLSGLLSIGLFGLLRLKRSTEQS